MLKTILLIVATVISGCTTTHVVRPGAELIIEKQARLLTRDDQSLDVFNVLFERDSLVAFDIKSQKPYYFHISEIDNVIVTNRFKGALMGASIGFLALGLPAYSIAPSFAYGFPLLLIFGSIGGGVCSIPGAFIGSKDAYYFEYEQQEVEPIDSIKSTGAGWLNDEVYKERYTSIDSSKISILKSAMTRLPPKLVSPNNQIAGALFIRGGDHSTKIVFGFSARRFYRWETGYYLNYSYRYAEGDSELGLDGYSWNSTYHLLLLGVERLRKGSMQNGGAAFFELGLTAGMMSDRKLNRPMVYKVGPGVAGVIGVRVWSNLLFSEVQLSYDTLNDHFIPSVVVGYRF
jgi:hypothetical protein